MKLRLYATGGTVLLATLLATVSLIAVWAGMAHATVPPFDPAGNGATQGTLKLYDSSGTKVTGGALSNPPFYALASTDTGRNGDTLGSLYAATPQEGVNPINWPNDLISVPSEYPDTTAPGVLDNNPNALASNIFLWLDPSDPDSYAGNYPNVNTTASWQDLYQLRLFTSGPGQAIDPDRYSSATISVNTSNDTWTQVYPEVGASAPTVDSPATITGTKRVGFTVSCDAAFTGATSTSYKWFRGANVITSATSQNYTLVGADFDKMVKCRVTGTNATGSTSTTSTAVKIGLGDALVPTVNPSISGTPKPGNTLTCTSGTWTPAATSYKYQWFKGANAITGATTKNYTVLNGQVGSKLSCKVTAKRTGYANGVKKSAGVLITN